MTQTDLLYGLKCPTPDGGGERVRGTSRCANQPQVHVSTTRTVVVDMDDAQQTISESTANATRSGHVHTVTDTSPIWLPTKPPVPPKLGSARAALLCGYPAQTGDHH